LEPRSETYDAVVVGTGLGGLSAAACLAKAGKSVLVVERQDGPGGNAHAFRRGPYTFDPAIHVTAHGFNIEFLDVYLRALGAADRVDLIVLEELYSIDVCGARYTLPTGLENLVEYLAELFPSEADGIAAYIDACAQTTRESQAPPPRVALKDLEAAMAALPMLFKYRTSTLASAIDEFVADPQAKAILGAQWPYMGLPPSKLSFMAGTGVWMAFMEPGPVYVRGSFQKLADGLAEVIQESGGELLYERQVTSIQVDADGAVTGVVLDDGRELRAPLVVSNADALRTFEELVGFERLPPPFVRRLQRMRPSISAFMLYSACTLPVEEAGLAAEVFLYDHWGHDETWADVEAGRPGGMWLSLPTLHDSSLAPAGEHLVVLTSLMPYDIGRPWSEAKERYQEELIERVEAVLPGYRESITFVDSATPETFERYTLAQNGAIYGWENTPNQTMPKRLNFETPIGGLYLAGHWTDPGTGSVRCLLSGLRTAAAIEGERDPIAFLSRLG
jgi:prolycopene isomerase